MYARAIGTIAPALHGGAMSMCFLALTVLSSIGCDAVDDGASDRGGDPQPSCGDGGRCAIADCADGGVVSIEWSEAVAIGGSAEDAFGSLEGSCEAPFTWNGAGAEPTVVEPPSGQTTVTVSVELDRQSARLSHVETRGATGGRCHDVLSVDGHVSVRTADGVFDDEADVTLQSRERAPRTFGFQVALEDVGGTLAVELEDGARGSLGYTLSGADAACAGEVRLNVQSSRDGIGMASSGGFASWSSSDCPVGETPLDPNEPAAPGAAPLADTIAAVWDDASYPGEWDDGLPTELNVRVELQDGAACREAGSGAVSIPVRATYGTADGRIEVHSTDANVRAGFGASGETRSLQLWIADVLSCEDAGDPLPYTLAGCDELESVEIQLGINSESGAISFSDSGLNAYESRRDAAGAPGAADVLRTLVLMQDD